MLRDSILTIIVILIAFIGVAFLSQWARPDFYPFYNLKRFEEKIIEITKINPEARADYDMQLLQYRLEDVEYITDNEEYNMFVPTSLRYSTTAGDLTNWVLGHSLNDKKKVIVNFFKMHQSILEKILRKNGQQGSWKFIQDDINYLTIYENELQGLTRTR